jgi:hypothetical protein
MEKEIKAGHVRCLITVISQETASSFLVANCKCKLDT